ncbi:unnamed protein product [Caenorhabditis brenneri]
MSKKSEKTESIESTWTVLPSTTKVFYSRKITVHFSEKPAGPFLLEVTPGKLVVPSTGNLEVKIRNPTEKKCIVYVYFDSFFWLMKVKDLDNINYHGVSKSMCFHLEHLKPKEAFTFTIGYHDAKYKTGKCKRGLCDIDCFPDCEIHSEKIESLPPCERKNYSHERPEGVLLIRYAFQGDLNECSYRCECPSYKILHNNIYMKRPVDNFPTKRMDLYLKDETEEYKKYREQFEEIRKEQERNARWGHVLVNEDGVTSGKFRDLDGTIRDYGDPYKKETEWERDILPDLKQLDAAPPKVDVTPTSNKPVEKPNATKNKKKKKANPCCSVIKTICHSRQFSNLVPPEVVMDSKRNEPKSAKSEKSPIQPFLLEITPEQLVVPSTGNLEVKIRNPTKESHRVNVYFDSFFWLMKVEGNDSPECRADDSNCVCYGFVTLEPGQSRTLVIGYHDAQFLSYYKSGDLGDCDAWCDKDPCPEHMGKGLLKVPPSERFYYNHERPEGFLVVKYQTQTDEMEEILHQGWLIKRQVKNFLTKRMDLQLKDETEEYKKYREQFLEIRKEQARRARWGHVLVNEDGVTKEKFRDLNGTIRDYGYDEEPSQNVQKSTKPNVSVAPPKRDVTPTNNKPVEKPNATKNKKKKKANPCCSVM